MSAGKPQYDHKITKCKPKLISLFLFTSCKLQNFQILVKYASFSDKLYESVPLIKILIKFIVF